MEEEQLKIQRSNGVIDVTLNRDHKRNAFSQEMSESLIELCQQIDYQQDRILVIRAHENAKVWCAGHDLSVFDQLESFLDNNPMLALFDALMSCPIPIMNLITGDVYAGGLCLAICADFNLARSHIKVGMPLNKMGLPLNERIYGQFIHTIGLMKTKQLLLTGQPIYGESVLEQLGLFTAVFADQQALEEYAYQLIEGVKSCSPMGIRNSKLELNALANSKMIHEDAHDLRREVLLSEDLKNRVASMQNKFKNHH